jgi:hypothetical protein
MRLSLSFLKPSASYIIEQDQARKWRVSAFLLTVAMRHDQPYQLPPQRDANAER